LPGKVRSDGNHDVRIRRKFARPVREIEHTWISLSDGCKLATRIWLPKDADENPVPAILEYLPYRKNDRMAILDSTRQTYFAGHGYAAVRVDMRGSGDSDGILSDEYLPQEQEDAVEVIRWLGNQAWCTGAIGMMGISWGGFNSLQIAARRPPELKAVISACSTDDRYADDVHYIGGCVLSCYMLSWASTMLANNARPPYPDVVGDRWREIWLERMNKTPPYVEAWLTHQRRDDYWKQGSVCEDYDALACPVYMIGGWADAYSNAILRFLGGYSGPRKALIGPWTHRWPDHGIPEPAIGFLQECLRWWDNWLKGIDTGINDEPVLRVWMQDSVEPRTCYEERPGRWVAEESWPSPNIATRRFFVVDERGLDEAPASEAQFDFVATQATGLDAGDWGPYGAAGEFPPDQRAEDGRSLSFTSAPLSERVEILGFPEVKVELACDRPHALLAVRLCDVAPRGSSTLISRGILNLTHRESDEHPALLIPGERYSVRVRLKAVAYAIPAGHRLRVALSPTYWPWVWPSPEPVTLTLFTGAVTNLELPVRPPRPEDANLRPFEPPENAPPPEVEILRRPATARILRHDLARNAVELTIADHLGFSGLWRFQGSGVEYEETGRDIFSIVEGDPLSAKVRCERRMAIARGNWRTRVETQSVMSCDTTNFLVTNVLEAYDGETRVFAKTWTLSVPRDFV
jgi:uncharacterized protein